VQRVDAAARAMADRMREVVARLEILQHLPGLVDGAVVDDDAS
jgi:hypothetical protein